MPKTADTRIETEKKFRCKHIDKLVEHAVGLGFKKVQENSQEHDIYFTDKNYEFIKQRICLRIRQTENYCEITHKGKSQDTGALYSKLENNIDIAHEHRENAIVLLEALWFVRYIDIKKTRNMYRKDIGNLSYHIAIDYIEDAGYFVEFELLSQENWEKDKLQVLFEYFLSLFSNFDLQEEVLPYRDIVKKLSI